MKTFYIAIDNFSWLGHPKDTLRALLEGCDKPCILITQKQEKKFKKKLSKNCKLIEELPNGEDARKIPAPVLGVKIAKILIENRICKNDLVVLKIPFPHLLLSVVCALCLSKLSKSMPKVSILISQTDDGYPGESTLYKDVFEIISNLPSEQRNRFVLLHERKILLNYWKSFYPKIKMGLCGYVNEWIKPCNVDDGSGDFRLVYMGEARREKGFNKLAHVLATNLLNDQKVLIHCDANQLNMDASYFEAIQILKNLASEGKGNIKLIHQRKDNCFEKAFNSKNIALFLYSTEYGYRGSGIIQECAAAGMYAIAYEDLNFHLDFPKNVVTIKRTDNNEVLAKNIARALKSILAKRQILKPNVLTAENFRKTLIKYH